MPKLSHSLSASLSQNLSAGASSLLAIKAGSGLRLLPPDDIRLISACENYTEVTLAKGERLLVRRTMAEWSRLLPAGQFARVHRGLFANLDSVIRVERRRAEPVIRLHFVHDVPAPLDVKRRHWPAFRTRLDLWRRGGRAGQKKLDRARIGLPAPVAAKSIAVLPFVNLSRDPANESFCDGLSEELLNVLAAVPGLRVAARTSSFYFKGRNAPLPEIASHLGVDFVVEGGVRKAGRRVRITAQLIATTDGFHLWSDNFERELTDVFAVQDEIAGVIASNLQLKLARPIRSAATIQPEAQWLVLEGRHLWNLRTHDALQRAEQSFARALAIDPGLAAAHAGLADVCNIRALYRLADGFTHVADDLARARVEARQALHLDPMLGEAQATLGFVAFHEGRLSEAHQELRQAVALSPNYATGFQFYAWTLAAQGRLPQALAEYEHAIALDPLSFINLDRHAALLALAGNFSAALAANERAAALRSDVFVGNLSQRATILLALGRKEEAIAAARLVRRLGREMPFRRTSDADAIHALCQAGHVDEAGDYAEEILKTLPDKNYLRGFVLAAMGRFPEGLPCLAHTPTIMLPFLYWSTLWEPARESAGFRKMMAGLGRTKEFLHARAAR